VYYCLPRLSSKQYDESCFTSGICRSYYYYWVSVCLLSFVQHQLVNGSMIPRICKDERRRNVWSSSRHPSGLVIWYCIFAILFFQWAKNPIIVKRLLHLGANAGCFFFLRSIGRHKENGGNTESSRSDQGFQVARNKRLLLNVELVHRLIKLHNKFVMA
jgi:hypothetical protein